MAELTKTAMKYLTLEFFLAAAIGTVFGTVALYYLNKYGIIKLFEGF
jgi:predicted membrane protein